MFFDRICVDGFRSLRDVDINCKNKSVFVLGENGKGKTSLLEAISLLLCGKFNKNVTISDSICDYKHNGVRMYKDFNIVGYLSDGTILERTSGKCKMTKADGTVITKVSELTSNLSFDPDMFFNLSYVKQLQIADFLNGDKAFVNKLCNLIIDLKRIEVANTTLTRYNQKIDSEITAISSVLESFKDDTDIDKLRNEIDSIKEEISNMEMSYTEDYLNNQRKLYTDIEYKTNRITQLKDLFDKFILPDSPKYDIEYLKMIQKEMASIISSKEKIKQVEKTLDELNDLKNNHINDLKDFLSLDVNLIRNNYTTEDLSKIEKVRKATLTYLTTEKYTSDNTANGIMEFLAKKGNIDSRSIINAKETYLRVKNGLAPFKEHINKYKGLGIDASNIEERINKDIESNKSILKDLLDSINRKNVDINIDSSSIPDLISECNNYNNMVNKKEELDREINKLTDEIAKHSHEIKLSKEDIEKYSMTQITINNNIRLVEVKIQLLNKIESERKQFVENQKHLNELKYIKDQITNKKDLLKKAPAAIRHTLLEPVTAIANYDFKRRFPYSNLPDIRIDWANADIYAGDRKYEALSGAQTITLAMVLRQAILKRVGSFIPLMLIDEPTACLDDKRLSDLKTFLNELTKTTQLFVSTHDINIIDETNSIVIDL